ncbi:hypothetical protein MAUB1S_11411 [Mycolicibacterium aubagnense]
MQTVSDAPSIAGPGHNLATVTEILKDRFADLMDEAEAIATRANNAKDGLEEGKVDTDDQSKLLIEIGLDASKLAAKLDKKRLETTQPLRDEVDETNEFFNTIGSRMKRVKSAFESLVGAYDTAKREAEKRAAAKAAEEAAAEAKRKLDEAAAAGHSIESEVILQEAARAEHRAQHLAGQALSAGTGPTRTDAGTVSQRTNWVFRIKDASKIDLNKLRPHIPIADIEKAIRAHIRANRDTVPLKGVEIYPDTKATFRS